MSYADIIGQMLQQGLGAQAPQRMQAGARQAGGGGIEAALGALLGGGGQQGGAGINAMGSLGRPTGQASGAPAGGLGDLLGAVLGAAAGGGAVRGGAGGGLADMLGAAMAGGAGRGGSGGGLADMLGAAMGGGAGRSGAGGGLADILGAAMGGGAAGGGRAAAPRAGAGAGGGLGDLLGGLLTGGGGAAGGSALAMLGGLAITALQQMQAAPEEPAAQAQAVTSDHAAEMVLLAMLSAMVADGRLDDDENARLTEHLSGGGVTQQEIDFVNAALERPADPNVFASAANDAALAAQIYAASIVAIEIDTAAERDYLRRLAAALRLNPATVAKLHQMTGAPAA